jgi:hypothetical protein
MTTPNIVKWTPKPPNKWKHRTIEGILVETIKNQDNEPGWHILSTKPEDQNQVFRCWSSNGHIETLTPQL